MMDDDRVVPVHQDHDPADGETPDLKDNTRAPATSERRVANSPLPSLVDSFDAPDTDDDDCFSDLDDHG
jgi:hypothetical protein